MLAPATATRLTRLVRLIGLVAVVWGSVGPELTRYPLVTALTVVSWLGWAGWALLPRRDSAAVRWSLVVMGVAGGLSAAYLPASLITAYAVAFGGPALLGVTLTQGLALSSLATGSLLISALVAQLPARGVASMAAGAVVAMLLGVTRGQTRLAAEQNRLLLEQNRTIRAERDRAAALAERGRIARDIHDVLAHTLGGLALQLDAADALLEAGRVDEAAGRVRSSYRLALSGLADARRVVGTLRAGDFEPAAELGRLAREHREAGGTVELRLDTELAGLDEQAGVAVLRAVQESLTNARKHAAGQPVTLTVRDEDADLVVTVTNPLTSHRTVLGPTGSGAGLLGMSERLRAVGGTADARRVRDRWEVRLTVGRTRGEQR
ncbi:sensor histidine kinase [Nocardia stercoris]|uniref:sensor histidine kinase n=1 Tax=Nocardia stercoris TaxID=2483361 RepID=UPI0011C3DD36|nr:histidine kinase [Nocardia stercoris]